MSQQSWERAACDVLVAGIEWPGPARALALACLALAQAKVEVWVCQNSVYLGGLHWAANDDGSRAVRLLLPQEGGYELHRYDDQSEEGCYPCETVRGEDGWDAAADLERMLVTAQHPVVMS